LASSSISTSNYPLCTSPNYPRRRLSSRCLSSRLLPDEPSLQSLPLPLVSGGPIYTGCQYCFASSTLRSYSAYASSMRLHTGHGIIRGVARSLYVWPSISWISPQGDSLRARSHRFTIAHHKMWLHDDGPDWSMCYWVPDVKAANVR